MKTEDSQCQQHVKTLSSEPLKEKHLTETRKREIKFIVGNGPILNMSLDLLLWHVAVFGKIYQNFQVHNRVFNNVHYIIPNFQNYLFGEDQEENI